MAHWKLSDDDLALLRDVPEDQLSSERLRRHVLNEGIRPEKRPSYALAALVATLLIGVSSLNVWMRVVDPSAPVSLKQSVGTIATRVEVPPPSEVIDLSFENIDVPQDRPVVAPPIAPKRSVITTAPVAAPRTFVAKRMPRSRPSQKLDDSGLMASRFIGDADAFIPRGTISSDAPKISATAAAPRPSVMTRKETVDEPSDTVIVISPSASPQGTSIAVEQEASSNLGVGG